MDKINLSNNVKFIFIISISLFLFQCNNYNEKKLGNGYVYFIDNEFILSTNGNYGDIPSKVINYNNNTKFIIASQQPLKHDPNVLLYDSEAIYNNGYDNVYYWIIIKKKDKVLGPMTKDEYMSARKKHNVPEKLRIE